MSMHNISARVTNRNTPESDRMGAVLHTVEYTDEKGEARVVTVYATDPMDAIKSVRQAQR